MLTAVTGEFCQCGIQFLHGLLLTHAVLQNFHQFALIKVKVRSLQTEIGNGKLHSRSLLRLGRSIILYLRLRTGQILLHILSGLIQGGRG